MRILESRLPDGYPPCCASCEFCLVVSHNQKIKGYKYKAGDTICSCPHFCKMVKSDAAVHIALPRHFYCVFYSANEARLKSLDEALTNGIQKKDLPKVPDPTRPFDPFDL